MAKPRHLCSAVFSLLVVAATGAGGQAPETEYYFGIEVNGVLCGYSRFVTSPMVQAGRELTLLKQNYLILGSALGSEFNTRLALTYHIESGSGQFLYHDSAIEQGTTKLGSTIRIEGDTARCGETLSALTTSIPLPADVVLENTLLFPHLKADFADRDLESRTYHVFEVRGFQVHDVTYTRIGREAVDLAGSPREAVVLDRLDRVTGLKTKHWIDTRSGQVLKTVGPGSRLSFLADPSIVDRIQRGDLGELFIAKVGVSIPDATAIRYMKVNAVVEPSGLWVTPELLSPPGQRFTGVVKENRVEGAFEMEPRRYDGTGAPVFPVPSGPDSLAPYVKAEGFIQSEDSVLVREAHTITAGSKDAWEAACRLSRWVSENIDDAIPGGTTARRTYDTRTGECGSHSVLLAAFCRAVGIPARVVWGCMYIPSYGGAFGQHAWNEIHMGDAGWIPVDATAHEIDYIDAGHIRVGVYQSTVTALNPIRVEVLDYRLGPSAAAETSEGAAPPGLNRFDPCVGQYTKVGGGDRVSVREQNGSLVLDIPDKVQLAFKDPTPEGAWVCTMTDRVRLTFEADTAGGGQTMLVHEIVRLRRTGPVEGAAEAPAELQPYSGRYLLAQVQAEFTVTFRDGRLVLIDPRAQRTVGLKGPDDRGRWSDDVGKNTYWFDREESGEVGWLVIDSVARFVRE